MPVAIPVRFTTNAGEIGVDEVLPPMMLKEEPPPRTFHALLPGIQPLPARSQTKLQMYDLAGVINIFVAGNGFAGSEQTSGSAMTTIWHLVTSFICL